MNKLMKYREDLTRASMGLPIALVEEKTCHSDNTNDRPREEKPTELSHLYLLHSDLVNDNAKNKENQCENSTEDKVVDRYGFANDQADHKNGKRNFSTVIEELGHIFARARVHGRERLSNSSSNVKMNMNKNYDNTSIKPRGCNVAKILVGFMLATFLLTANVMAETTATGSLEPVRIKTLETTSGTVANVDSSNISVAYKHTANAEYEMSLPIDQEVKLEYFYKISDLKAGDTVKLEYEKVVESPGEPGERTTMTVKKIRLVKKASKEKES